MSHCHHSKKTTKAFRFSLFYCVAMSELVIKSRWCVPSLRSSPVKRRDVRQRHVAYYDNWVVFCCICLLPLSSCICWGERVQPLHKMADLSWSPKAVSGGWLNLMDVYYHASRLCNSPLFMWELRCVWPLNSIRSMTYAALTVCYLHTSLLTCISYAAISS